MNKELNSLGIGKKPSDTTIVVAMSGGVTPHCCRHDEKRGI